MNRSEATRLILEAKMKKSLTWNDIASAVGQSEVWVALALLGQATMSVEEAKEVSSILDLNEEATQSLTAPPYRGDSIQMPPTDPLIYRLYELVMVYGLPIKELINEKFGDGIMSAIDFEMHIDKLEDPKGDRVVITLNGKFLPYKKF